MTSRSMLFIKYGIHIMDTLLPFNHHWQKIVITQQTNRVHNFCCVSDFSKIFKFKFAHLGGDEVNTSKQNCRSIVHVHRTVALYIIFIRFSEFQAAGPQHLILKDGVYSFANKRTHNLIEFCYGV
jgi:hypothetical protein